MNARPQTQPGIERPERKKSSALFMYFFNAKPMPRTKARYITMIDQSMKWRSGLAIPSTEMAPPAEASRVRVSMKCMSDWERVL